jgi:hypothetical protein
MKTWGRLEWCLYWSILLLFTGAALAGCGWLSKNPEAIVKAGEGAKAVAPLLPPPFGWIVSLAGAAAITLGGHFAGKSRAEAIKAGLAGVSLSPIVKLFAERKHLLPILMAGATAAKASGLLPISAEELTQIMIALGIPAAGEFAKDAMSGKPPQVADTVSVTAQAKPDGNT